MAGLSRVYGVDGDAVDIYIEEEKKRNCEPIGFTWLAFYILSYVSFDDGLYYIYL